MLGVYGLDVKVSQSLEIGKTEFQIVGCTLHLLHQINGAGGKAEGAQPAAKCEAPAAAAAAAAAAAVTMRASSACVVLERQLLPPNAGVGDAGGGVGVHDERALQRRG